MKALVGNFQYTLDEKNRIRMPSVFRKELGEDYVLIPTPNGTITVVREDQSYEFLSQILYGNLLDPDSSLNDAGISGFGCYVSTDNQGRFVLPDNFVKDMHIKKEVRVVGAFKNVQIWPEEAWQEQFGAGLQPDKINEIYRKINAAKKQK